MAAKTFNLRLWFALCSFGTIALICLVAGYGAADFLSRNLLERESEVSQEFLQAIVSVNGSDMFADDLDKPFVQSPLLIDFSKHIISMPGVMRVNIHSPSRRILWSTEPQIVGKIFKTNEELEAAFSGHRVTVIGDTYDDDKPEHVDLGDAGYFIESYMPIYDTNDPTRVSGVVELYKLPMALDDTIRRGRYLSWTAAGIAAILLFVSLYWIVQRGAQLIERQQDNLARMEAFAAIGQMASAVAHSLRNPMAGIRSSAELWRSLNPKDPTEAPEDIVREVERMDGYVRDLLSYARTEPYHLVPVELKRVIETILEKSQRAMDRFAIKASVAVPSGLRVNADDKLLEQALTSIVTNAIEAMPDGGHIEFTTCPSTVGTVRLSITDSGRGIPQDILRRVSESYFTTKVRGMGLGLVLSRGVIERFGGKLTIHSTPDIGTRVDVDLKAV